MNFKHLSESIYIGLTFNKPNVQSKIVKIDDEGFYYSIGQQGNSKKVLFQVFKQCLTRLQESGEFSRTWFNQAFPRIAKTAPCSFTTIGGLFLYFGLATYEKSIYVKS